MHRTAPWILSVLPLACASTLAGCVIVNADSHTRYEGRYVSDETLARIQPGASQEYVIALIGEPSLRTDLSDGSSIWKWAYSKKVTSQNHVLLLFSGDSSKESQGAVYVDFGPDHLVRRNWRD
jgi:outer membrane protein assembly factor BamE (lipoprotein component of BamABCDE complex)